MTRTEAAELANLVDRLIDEARASPDHEPFGSVNWGDIRCVEIERSTIVWPEVWVIDGDPLWFTSVLISVAAPGCGLCAWLERQLAFHRHRVKVVAEW